MSLPRFNSGELGKLRFDHLNQVFDAVEGGTPIRPPSMIEPDGDVIVAQLGTSRTIFNEATQVVRGYEFSWREIYVDATDRISTTPNGRSSSGQGSSGNSDPYAVPARYYKSLLAGIDPEAQKPFTEGTVVALKQVTFENGKRGCLIIGGSEERTAFHMVLDHVQIARSYSAQDGVRYYEDRWLYRGWRYVLSSFTIPGSNYASYGWTQVPGQNQEFPPIFFNSIEWVDDTSTVISTGSPKRGTDVERKPLRSGLIVAVHKDPLGAFNFCCVPNGYQINCNQ